MLILFVCSQHQILSGADLGYQGTHILTFGTMDELAKAFYKKYGIHLFIKGGGCSDGISAVVNKGFELGGLCCPLPLDKAKRHNLKSHRIAIDVKAVIVNPDTGITDLTLKQVSDIHKGIITNWKQVGGPDRPVALIFRDHCRDMDEPVRAVLGIRGPVAKKAIIVKTDKEVLEYVERFPAAIGVVSSVFTHDARVRTIRVDGVEPTPQNAEKGLYPLTGSLYIITKGTPSGWTKSFLDFVLSAEGQGIVGTKFGRVR